MLKLTNKRAMQRQKIQPQQHIKKKREARPFRTHPPTKTKIIDSALHLKTKQKPARRADTRKEELSTMQTWFNSSKIIEHRPCSNRTLAKIKTIMILLMKVKNYEEHHLEFPKERFHEDARGFNYPLVSFLPN